jgi:hypothetical protein
MYHNYLADSTASRCVYCQQLSGSSINVCIYLVNEIASSVVFSTDNWIFTPLHHCVKLSRNVHSSYSNNALYCTVLYMCMVILYKHMVCNMQHVRA